MDTLVFVQARRPSGELLGAWDHPRNGDSAGSEPIRASVLAWEANRHGAPPGTAIDTSLVVEGRTLDLQCLPLRADPDRLTAELTLVSERSEFVHAQLELARRLDFEELIAKLSTHFIDLDSKAVDQGIDHALRAIGEFAGVDRTYIFLWARGSTTMSNTHEWCAPGIEPQIHILQDLPMEEFPWSLSRIRRQEVVHIPRVEDMGEDAASEKAIFRAQSIQSIVLVPLVYMRRAEGFVGFDSVRVQKTWSASDIALLKIVGEMLIGMLARKRSEQERCLLEAQLVQTRSLENVGRLAGGVAHDFNNLLGVMLACATLLRKRLTDPELRGLADELIQSAQQASDLTRQLLIVGRRGIVHPMVLDIDRVLHSLKRLIQRTVGETIQLSLVAPGTCGSVRIGLPQLEQVILNLTMNARDAMPRGGQLTIETAPVELDQAEASRRVDVSPGRYVRLRMRDTGAGMSNEVAARAFEPFFTTKGRFGTGLGLSTVHSIVQQAGGYVVLLSEEQTGTTVELYLPVVQAEPAPELDEVTSEWVEAGQGETIVVAEDCTSLRNLMCKVLVENGYRVIEAVDSEEAVALCERHAGQIDLLLTDVIMPRLSGRQLADLARERWGLRRVAYVSGYDDDVLARQGVLGDGIRLLQKPFMDTELLAFVRDALGNA